MLTKSDISHCLAFTLMKGLDDREMLQWISRSYHVRADTRFEDGTKNKGFRQGKKRLQEKSKKKKVSD